MFTGIVQSVGEIRAVTARGGDVELVVHAPRLGLASVAVGDSIAVSGCCLTVTRLDQESFAADVSGETLSVTTLGQWSPGTRVNLEKALLAGQPLGGHYVTGHIDGIAAVVGVNTDARSTRMQLELPHELARYVARKGSICIDGVSLTVNDIDAARFGVNLIPHTLATTILGNYRVGSRANVEVDIIARYLERLGT